MAAKPGRHQGGFLRRARGGFEVYGELEGLRFCVHLGVQGAGEKGGLRVYGL